eukprot:symbB.v1.2.020950.t1/scaffold1788.1/size101334/5
MSRNTVELDSGSCAALLTCLGAGDGPWQMALWLLELGMEAMEALTPLVLAGRLTEALMVYREGKAAGVWPGERGSRLLDRAGWTVGLAVSPLMRC